MGISTNFSIKKAIMKFKFCGGLDCPDWILAEIATVAKISSIKFKQLAQEAVTQLLSYNHHSNLSSLSLETKLPEERLITLVFSMNYCSLVLQKNTQEYFQDCTEI